MHPRIRRLESELKQERKKTERLERSLQRAHRNLEELRAGLWGNKQVLNKAEEEFSAHRDRLLTGAW